MESKNPPQQSRKALKDASVPAFFIFTVKNFSMATKLLRTIKYKILANEKAKTPDNANAYRVFLGSIMPKVHILKPCFLAELFRSEQSFLLCVKLILAIGAVTANVSACEKLNELVEESEDCAPEARAVTSA